MKFTGEYYIPSVSSPRIEKEHLERYKFAQAFVKNKKVLDIACGTGYGSNMMLAAGAEKVDGVDISKEALGYARKHYKSGKLSFKLGDLLELKAKQKYDVVTSFETIEHISKYQLALKNIYTALKKEGILLISSPNRIITSPDSKNLSDKPLNKYHTQEFSRTELVNELENIGFQINKVYGQRFRPYLGNPKLQKLYNVLFSPNTKTSPIVSPWNKYSPKYIVVLAQKL